MTAPYRRLLGVGWRIAVAVGVPALLGLFVCYILIGVWDGPDGLGQWLWTVLTHRDSFITTIPALAVVVIALSVAGHVWRRLHRLALRSDPVGTVMGSGVPMGAALVPEWNGVPSDRDARHRWAARHEAAHVCAAWGTGGRVLWTDIASDGPFGGVTRSCAAETTSFGDKQWHFLVVDVAGHVNDLAAGTDDGGAVSDLSQAVTHGLGVLSSGRRPAGFDGLWTLDAVMLHAMATARDILAADAATHAAVTAALVATHGTRRLHEPELLAIRASATLPTSEGVR